MKTVVKNAIKQTGTYSSTISSTISSTVNSKADKPRAMNKRIAAGLFAMSASFMTASSANAVELLNLMVNESGMQRITYEELLGEGIDLRGLRNRKLNITLDGAAVPMRVRGQEIEGRNNARNFFGPGGYIEFYAKSAESLYSEERAYTLHFMNRRELAEVGRKVIERDRARTNPTANASNSYTHTITVEENNFYDFASPSSTDPWHFGQNFSIVNTPTYEFTLDGVVGGAGSAKVEAQMYGLLDFDIEGNDHHYEVQVNGTTVGDQQFDGNAVDTFTADSVPVNDGVNSFKYNFLPIAEVPFDIISLNRFQVSYERYSIATNNYLEGRFNTGHAAVEGIDAANNDFAVYRVSDDGEKVAHLVRARKDGSTVTFNTQGIEADYIVVGASNEQDAGYRNPRVQKLLTKQDIKSGNAEYLIIAHSSLMGDELNELVQLRSQRYAVKVVDVAQIYAQFGNYVADSQPIYDYIKYAQANLNTRFVVFVGNDTYDYKQFQTESVSLIPTRYVSTPGGQLVVTQTPSDAAYGDLNQDRVPDLPVGRISVRNKSELNSVVNKLKAYEARDGYAGRVLVAADTEDNGNGLSFTQDAEALIAAMPATWRDSIRSDFRAYPDVDGGQLAHEKTLAAINAGVSVVNFIGHSSHRRWSFSTPPMLLSTQISELTNVGKPSLVTQWGCWNSYFVDPAGNTMADEFLLGGENGAATVLGASTLTTSTEERALGVELNRRMYNRGITIGEAVIQAKQALAQREDFPAVQLGWQIIGDPALMVNP